VRAWPVRALRAVVQGGGVTPLLRRAVTLEVNGLDGVLEVPGPVVLVANHSSHLDTPVLLATLPAARRRATAVAVAADYFHSWWRGGGATLAFSTVYRQAPAAGPGQGGPAELLRNGWSVVVYPEETRSDDGYLATFGPAAAELALQTGVPVVPVALRGTYAAMPRGRSWPLPGRTRVSVRYGHALRPAVEEAPAAFTRRLEAAVRSLLAEDAGTWWATVCGPDPAAPDPPPGSWRRVWEQTQPPTSAHRPARVPIWRD
jgi:1-acyl-sn-glycerol-3-phosphate acyltransferase